MTDLKDEKDVKVFAVSSFNNDLIYNDERVAIKRILETSFSKEIRILLKEGQVLKEHKTGFPIVVHVVKGVIDFGVAGEVTLLEEGAIITLGPNVPHDLKAQVDSIVRLTLSKLDKAERVLSVANED